MNTEFLKGMNLNMIKLIATDIDGTLIPESTPDLYPEMVKEIGRLTDSGIMFCAASGRQYASIRNVFREVADKVVYIAENGALIRQGKETLSVTRMRRDYAEGIVKELRALGPGYDFVVSTPEGSLVETKNQEFIHMLTYGYHNEFRLVKDVLEEEAAIIKIAVYRPGSIRALGESVLVPEWENKVKACMAGEEWVDFMDSTVDKGNALKLLQSLFKISREETVAFGDNNNDIGLLEAAGVSYAVENAREDVKAKAVHVCPSYRDKGVWQIVSRIGREETGA